MTETKDDITLDLERVEQASARGQMLDFPPTLLSRILERFIDSVAAVINWIWAVLVLVIVANVIGRYALSVNYVWVEEVQWHLYAIGYMLGIGYALRHDGHVRVDALALHFRPITRAWIELFGILILIAPVIYMIVSYAIPFVDNALQTGERSAAPNGLGNRWAMKAVVLIAFIYLGIATLARLSRVMAFLWEYHIGRSLPRAITTGITAIIFAITVYAGVMPFYMVMLGPHPRPRDVERLLASVYQRPPLRITELDCGGLFPSVEIDRSGERARLLWRFGWRCAVTASITGDRDDLLFGQPMVEGAEIRGTLRLDRTFRWGEARSALMLVSDPRSG